MSNALDAARVQKRFYFSDHISKALTLFKTFDSGVINHESFLQTQLSHFNFIKENPDLAVTIERNRKLKEEVNKFDILDDMNSQLGEMKKIFPEVSLHDEMQKFDFVKMYV